MLPSAIDHRFFYSAASVGNYTCGVARDAVSSQLRLYGCNSFGVTEYLTSLDAYIHNPSVTGFFIEHAVLETIASCGLNDEGIRRPMSTFTFQGFPTFQMEKSLALYVPSNFNYHDVDGLVLKLDLKTKQAYMFPIQVTKSHGDSERSFFNNWASWTRGLDDFEITATFLWITLNDPWLKHTDDDYGMLRGGKRLKTVAHTTRNILLEVVNKTIWNRYEKALRAMQIRSLNKLVEDNMEDDTNGAEKEIAESASI